MSYLGKVECCNRRDLSRYRPFMVDGARLGWITHERAAALAAFPAVFTVSDAAVFLNAALKDAEARSAAFAGIVPALTATGLFPQARGEIFPVKDHWSDPEAFRMDRGLTSAFGVRAYGVHANGYVRKDGALHLWIGTRGSGRMVEPGKLDSMVGGGQPAGLSLMDNLVKECAEEAGLDETLARSAKPAGAISYSCERGSGQDRGLRVDTLFIYDLELPSGFMPRCDDDEIVGFDLLPLTGALALVRDTDRFKFNVNLVVLDFAIRHGVLCPDTEPHYERILAGMHNRA